MRIAPRCLAFVAAFVVTGCQPSTADSGASSRELARAAVHEALAGGAYDALVAQAIAASYAVARNRIEGSGRVLSAAQAQQLETSLRGVFADVYPRDAWEEALVPVFLNAFDRNELAEVRRFQQTALGKKLLIAQAQLSTGGGALGQQFIQSRQAEFSRRLGESLGKAWNTPATK